MGHFLCVEKISFLTKLNNDKSSLLTVHQSAEDGQGEVNLKDINY
jgi:hypothetical protein